MSVYHFLRSTFDLLDVSTVPHNSLINELLLILKSESHTQAKQNVFNSHLLTFCFCFLIEMLFSVCFFLLFWNSSNAETNMKYIHIKISTWQFFHFHTDGLDKVQFKGGSSDARGQVCSSVLLKETNDQR